MQQYFRKAARIVWSLAKTSLSTLDAGQEPDNSTPDFDEQSLDDATSFQGCLGSLTNEIIVAVKDQDLGTLSTLVAIDFECLNHQDREGNTLLLVAARHGCYESLTWLLEQPSVDASICNYNQEPAFHILSHFDDDQIKALVPQIVRKKKEILIARPC